MQEQIRHLIDLQALDIQIYSLRDEKMRLPVEIEEINRDFEEKKKILVEIEEKKKDLFKKKKDKELELSVKEENIKKLQIQLYQLKTNKEYQAMIGEIQGHKADGSLLEEQIIRILDETDDLDKQIKEQKDKFVEEEKQKNLQVDNIKNRILEIENTIKDLDFKRTQLTKDIDKKFLVVYERVLKNRDGLALVKVKDGACRGCFMNVPPQIINEIKMQEHLVICEICSRILYIEEDILEKG